jgi:16S rRNA (guanine(966)-N(2))-methyltransferase RsmD
MRIIAGSLKGRRLHAPKWEGLRPTSDKLRETLFNVVAPRIAGAIVLDGYAGSGAVGIEALSRGAAHVTFVERDRRAVALIEANLEHCGVTDRYAIIRARFAGNERPPGGGRFDLIFLDPPYGPRELNAALEAAGPLVAEGSLLIVEHAKRDPAPATSGLLVRTREIVSGDSALTLYQRSGETGRDKAGDAASNKD